MSDAHGGQTGLKVLEKTYLSPQFSCKWQSSLFLKIFSDEDVTICSGKQFQLSHNLSETRKPSCRWQTRATLAKSLHGLRKSSGVVSCIAGLPIDSLPMVSYYVLYSNCVATLRPAAVSRACKYVGSKATSSTNVLYEVSPSSSWSIFLN